MFYLIKKNEVENFSEKLWTVKLVFNVNVNVISYTDTKLMLQL